MAKAKKAASTVTLSMTGDQLVRALGVRGYTVKGVKLASGGVTVELAADAEDDARTSFDADQCSLSEQSTVYRGERVFTRSVFEAAQDDSADDSA